MAAMEAYRFLGSPEGDLSLAQAAVYLATAPKSNSIYTAYGKALKPLNRPAPWLFPCISTPLPDS
ncbi:MAG: hypothetical protein R2860_08140 [Desulfobacterales bacterium]